MRKNILTKVTIASLLAGLAVTSGANDAFAKPSSTIVNRGAGAAVSSQLLESSNIYANQGLMQLAENKTEEGKCGEGKCGDKKGGEKKEGKCGDKEGGKKKEGKCGEGKCGDKG